MSERLLDTILFKKVSATYWSRNDKVQDDTFPLFFNANNGKAIDTKNMYNTQEFKEIGIKDLQAGLACIHMTNLMFASGATTDQHVLMMAHSLSTARDSCFTKGTEDYNSGIAKIIDMQKDSQAGDRQDEDESKLKQNLFHED